MTSYSSLKPYGDSYDYRFENLNGEHIGSRTTLFVRYL